MRNSLAGFSTLLLFVFVAAKASQESSLSPDGQAWVQQTLRQMTSDEKVGQMIMPTIEAVFTNIGSDAFKSIDQDIELYHVGGYLTYSGDPAALAILINRMQKLAKIPLAISADLEGGPGFRFTNATRVPRAMALGATGSEELAYQAGKITAIEGRALGISINFYPVVDVNNNPANPIINIRSFGEDPALVSRMARAYIHGVQENGQLATAKHFPGHGDTSQDSHLELPTVDVPRARLNEIELPPFKAAIDAGVAAVMTSHIYLPQLESEKALPASLSKEITTGLLREELGFKGLVFTDAMTMQGVTAQFSPGEAAVRAVSAGADVILIPVDVEKTFTALRNAVSSGRIPISRINDSVQRILEAKARLGLHRNRFVDLDRIDEVVGSEDHKKMAQTMIERAITLVRDEMGILPLKLTSEQRVLVLNIMDAASGYREGTPGPAFTQEFLKRHKRTAVVQADERTSKDTYAVIKKLADASDVIVANGFIRVSAYKGSIALNDDQLDLIRYLSESKKPVAFVLFGSPYLLSFVPELPTYVLTYEYYPEAERAAARAILGEAHFAGKLPVSMPGDYAAGFGIDK